MVHNIFEKKLIPTSVIIDAIMAADLTSPTATVIAAEDAVAGSWVGASGNWYDVDTKIWWKTVRRRTAALKGHTLLILKSTDGITFATENTLLLSGMAGSLGSLEGSALIYNRNISKWQLFMSGSDGTNWRIYKFTDIADIDTANFAVASNVVVIDKGTSGDWDDNQCKDPSIHQLGRSTELIYAGQDGTVRRLGAARSIDDGANFVKYSGNPILDVNSWAINDGGPHPESIIHDGANWFVPYHGGPNTNIGFASWDSKFNGQLVDHTPAAGWSPNGYWYLRPLVVDNILYLYYDQVQGDSTTDHVVKTIDLSDKL